MFSLRFLKYAVSVIVLVFPVIAISQSDRELFVDESFENRQRPGVIFDHDTHLGYYEIDENCSVCHHVYDDGVLIEGESSEDMSCSECHGVKPENKGETPLMSAYHKQCISCHEKVSGGPLMCGECHRKQP